MATIEEVLTFIHDFKTNKGAHANGTLDKLFSQGYCYYFAVILKDAFGGEIVWPKYCEHILWLDSETNTCYDIHGVVTDYNERDILPISVMTPSNLKCFMHITSDSTTDEEFFEQQGKINEYEFSNGWPLSRVIIDGIMDEFNITKIDSDTYHYDIVSATLQELKPNGYKDFLKDNGYKDLCWINVERKYT